MTYYTIDLNKMDDKSKVFYLSDLVADLVECLNEDNGLNIDEVIHQAKKALNQLEVK